MRIKHYHLKGPAPMKAAVAADLTDIRRSAYWKAFGRSGRM